MNLDVPSMLFLSILTTILMIVVSLLMYSSDRRERSLHTLEFWTAYLAYFILSYLTQGYGPKIVALATLGLIWRTRTVALIASDVAETNLLKKWHFPFIFGSYGVSLALTFFDLPFMIFTLPAAFSIFLVGMNVIYLAWKEFRKSKLTPLHYLFLFNLLVMYVHILDYPFVRYNSDFTVLGFFLVLLTTLIMAIVLPGLTIHDLLKERSRILEVVLNERNLQLEKQSKMSALGEMTASLVHELNNPINLLLNRNGLMRRKVEKDQYNKEALLEGLGQMDNTIHRMMKITKSLKSFSRNSEKDAKKLMKLNHLIEETLAFSSERFLEGNIPLLIGRIPEVQLECRGVQISQVLLNLLNNAFDAVEGLQGQWVRVDFEQLGDRLKILVIDSGKGIPEEIRQKIMQPFFTTKESGKGTGLGLSISQQIIKDHGGRLFLGPDLLNTTFVIELPCQNC